MKWEYWGQKRPPFAETPGANQESVWDYPRPPRVVPTTAVVEVRLNHECLIRTDEAIRVLETAGPPTYYLPPSDELLNALQAVEQETWCEWKGTARYWALRPHEQPESTPSSMATAVAWSYPEPTADYAVLKDYLAFYPARVACFVDGERVQPQGGGYYGGWVTRQIVGPWKGDPGTAHW